MEDKALFQAAINSGEYDDFKSPSSLIKSSSSTFIL